MSIGTTRNLTQQFLKHRNFAAKARSSVTEDRATAKLLGAALDGGDFEAGSPGVSAAYAPGWVQKSEKIKADMGLLKDRINKLKEYHGKALLVSFDSDNEAQQRTDAVTREAHAMFKKLDKEIRSMDQRDSSDDDQQVRKTVQQQLAQALFKLSVEFRKEETRFLNRMEAQKGLEAGSSLGLVEDDGGTAQDGSSYAVADPGFTQAQMMRVNQAEGLAQERDEEIRKVVEAIMELAQIMRDLSTLVVEQGTMLDRVDHNITQAAVSVETGVKELVQAEKHQKQGRAMLCIIALIVMIVVMLIVVIVRHTI